jgi:hypothetical protein
MAGSAILLEIIAKAPDGVASIAGVSTGGFGHGVGTFLAASGMGYQGAQWASGAAVQGGKQLGQAVRNAVKSGRRDAASRALDDVAVMEYTGLSRYVWHLPLFFLGLVILFSDFERK